MSRQARPAPGAALRTESQPMTEDTTTLHYATIEELRLGMFVHLEGGWLAHPFPLSNFKLSSPQQIATIRSLGLQRVRWTPSKSDLEAPAQDARHPAAAAADATGHTATVPHRTSRAAPGPGFSPPKRARGAGRWTRSASPSNSASASSTRPPAPAAA
jgi:hypothetical protein